MTTAVAKKTRTLVVDCDTHFWQPLAQWEQHIPATHKDAIVTYLTPKDDDGSKYMREKTAPFQAIKGGDDPVERIKWMDEEGIAVNLIFPGAGLVTYLPDPDAVSAACRALNTWASRFAAHAPDRLKPCMVLPWRYPEHALEEFRYATQKLKLEAIFAAPTPVPERRWSDQALDPLWKAIQDAGVGMTFHEFSRAPSGNVVARASYKDSYPMMYLCGHTVEAQLCVMDLILGGVLERFPRLNVGFVEAHCAWLPGWLALMDSLWPRTSTFFSQYRPAAVSTTAAAPIGALSMKPSDYFRRQCFIVAFPDDAWVEENVKYVGEDNVAICTDYPHPQTRYHVTRTLDQHQPWLTERVRRKILGENAARFLGFKARAS